MTTTDAEQFIEVAALDAAYDAGVQAAIEVIESFQGELDEGLMLDIVDELEALQEVDEVG